MPRRFATRVCTSLIIAVSPWLATGEEPLSFETLGGQYDRQIRPLMDRFCVECHSTDLKEGELDLERFHTLVDLRQESGVWRNVLWMLSIGEMPPEDADPLSAEQRTQLQGWVGSYLAAEARSRAGDPGLVVLRRLNNVEYTYTIRDLTGVQLDPAREFPTDGAAGEGFTNTGQSLAMSPALARKYLDSGKRTASHAVLLPDGFRFSPHTTRRDWTDQWLAELRDFYRQFAEPEELGGTYDNNLTKLGLAGRVPLEKYLSATIELRDAASAPGPTIKRVAREKGLSPRYLDTIWSFLSDPGPAIVWDDLRSRWRNAQPQDVAALAAEFAAWQNTLWTFGPIAKIGTETGPSRWMVPLEPVVTHHEMTIAIPAPAEGEEQNKEEIRDVVLSLVATDMGDGNEHDYVTWQRPRLVMEGQPDLLLRDLREVAGDTVPVEPDNPADQPVPWGLDPARFGKHPLGQPIDEESLCFQAPSGITFRIPAHLAVGRAFVTTAVLDEETGAEGTAQVELVSGVHPGKSGLQTIDVDVKFSADKHGQLEYRKVVFSRPILVGEKSRVRQRIVSSLEAFRDVFPASLCYMQIVPVDDYLTVKLFYREDEHLIRLMLDAGQRAQLEQLWKEFHYVSQSALLQRTSVEMFLDTVTRSGGNYEIYKPLLAPIIQGAEAFKTALIESEPRHLDALLEFASRAYRRPLTERETQTLRALYMKLREQQTPHDEAFRLTLARVFASPEFLYRLEERKPVAAPETDHLTDRTPAHPVSDLELASRLSYFLWSSLPDGQLREAAVAGRLTRSDADTELSRLARRMLKDPRVRRLAIQFACQWLHIRDFDQLQEKSKTEFPGFAALQKDMYEESIRFFTDMFQNDGSILDILRADHTFLNEQLAAFYGIPAGQVGGPLPVANEPAGNGVRSAHTAWRRVDGVSAYSRGGILTQATILARQSGASRTNPILRGNFVFETLLGQRMPRPPKDVPELPDDIPEGLTERALIEQHSSVEACAKCHTRIDPYGFVLEKFDAIGRFREVDSHGHPIDAGTTLIDGTKIEGLKGLQDHLLTTRRDEFVRQFCRKLLGYSLGRGVQLSDEPLLDEMLERLENNEFRFTVAVDTIILSDQFRMIRARPSPQ